MKIEEQQTCRLTLTVKETEDLLKAADFHSLLEYYDTDTGRYGFKSKKPCGDYAAHVRAKNHLWCAPHKMLKDKNTQKTMEAKWQSHK